MEIVYHIGANCTDGERLLKSLLRNVDRLAGRGVAVPGPGRYRRLLREAIAAEAQGIDAPGSREVILDAVLDGRDVRRVVLSNAAFMALPSRIFEGGQPFGNAANKLSALRRIFPGDAVELHMAMRNPATFIPAAWDGARVRGFDAFMAGMDPRAMRWSEIVARLRAAAPDMPLTVWCNEDTPLLWAEIMGRLVGQAGGDAAAPGLAGRYDLLAAIMSPEGTERFERYMGLHPGQTAEQERRVIGAFLDKYALLEETWDEVDLPGWDDALVDDLTRAYEADVARVAAIPGVTFIQP